VPGQHISLRVSVRGRDGYLCLVTYKDMISAASDFQFGRFGLGKVLNQLLLVVVHSMRLVIVKAVLVGGLHQTL